LLRKTVLFLIQSRHPWFPAVLLIKFHQLGEGGRPSPLPLERKGLVELAQDVNDGFPRHFGADCAETVAMVEAVDAA